MLATFLMDFLDVFVWIPELATCTILGFNVLDVLFRTQGVCYL